MNLLVVPKPLFNSEMEVAGYYFSYQYGNALIRGGLSNRLDGAMHSPLLQLINKVGLEALTMGRIIFVPVTPILLMMDLELNCREEEIESIVLLIDSDQKLTEDMINRIKRFKTIGFRLGVKAVTNATLGNLSGILPLTEYIFASGANKDSLQSLVRTLKPYSKNMKIIATELETPLLYQQAKMMSVHLFDGNFYKIPASTKEATISPMKINYIQMLNTINSADFELENFTKVVRQDASLQVQFMRLVNSSYQFTSEVKSLKQAAAILGQKEIRRWATTAVAASMNSDRPSEITRLSMLRARFCENCAGMFDQGMNRDDLFLMGLFSVIDVALDIPLEKALAMVFIPDRVKEALLNETGEAWEVMEFIKMYEQANWHGVSRIALLRNLEIADIHEAYVGAVTWYSNLIKEGLGQDV